MISIRKAKANPLALVGRVIVYVAVIVGAFAFALPFLWMVRTSVMSPAQVSRFPPEWIPEAWYWSNWARPFEVLDVGRYFRNTIVITVITLQGTLLSNLPVAYGFARLRFRGRQVLFVILLSTMMLPSHVTLIPTYVLFSKLGWVDSYKPLTVPSFFGNAFFIFLLRQFFMTIPRELDDAAKIDGCGIFGIFWRIGLPLSKPALGIVTVMSFTSTWNDFFGPLIYLWQTKKFPIAVGLWSFMQRLTVERGPLMAATIVAVIPVLMLFFVAQRHFIQGIVITGVKG